MITEAQHLLGFFWSWRAHTPFINFTKFYLCSYKLAYFKLHPLQERALKFIQVSKQRPLMGSFPTHTNAFTVSPWKIPLLYPRLSRALDYHNFPTDL